MSRASPLVHKKLTANNYEKQVFERYPKLKEYMNNVKEGDEFKLENLTMRVIETPGHKDDHLSYGLTSKD